MGQVGRVEQVGRIERAAYWLLLTCAIALVLLSAAAWLSSGFRLSAGPIRISATDPSRILLQAAVAWLLASLVPRQTRAHVIVRLLPIVALLAAAVSDSFPRRVGDAGEYVAMALNMSHGGGPALLPGELLAVTEELSATPGYGELDLAQPLVGRDGRQDLYHFWLYPLLVAPVAALGRAAGIQVNYAFTVVNLLLLVSLLYWLVRRERFQAAVLLAAGPLLWWIDKAHTEVFLFVALAFAALLIDRAPTLALIAAALAAAQNPGALVVLAFCIAALALSGARVSLISVLGSIAIGAIAPAYYIWHLGIWSPLSSTIQRTVPGLRALITPLVDPNLGLFVYAPILCAIACVGITGQSKRRWLVVLGSALVLLIVFGQSPNMNHGGSLGMSRYAIWLLALATPFIVEGSARLVDRRQGIAYAACAASVVFSIVMFRPAWPEGAGRSPTQLATALWTRVPALDNPVPEVFSELATGRDGFGFVPIATRQCEKILVRGDGEDAWWPVPCEPKSAPAACRALDALCYVNDGVFAPAPKQPGFGFVFAPEHSWTTKNNRRFDAILSRLGNTLRITRLADGGRFAGGRALTQLYLLEGSTGGAAWVRSAPEPRETPALTLNLARPSQVEIFDDQPAPFRAPMVLPAGTHSIDLPASAPLLFVVTDAP